MPCNKLTKGYLVFYSPVNLLKLGLQFMEKNFFLLLHIAKNNGLGGEFVSSTSKIAKEFGISQQSASRKLRSLAKLELISLQSSTSGVRAKVLEKGKKILLEHFAELSGLFSKSKTKKLFGAVQSGLGEGRYYLSFKQYSQQIIEKLGFDPFIGTLNLQVSEPELVSFKNGLEEIYINGFSTKERSFGGLRAFRVSVNGKVDGALVFPDRTNLPPNIAEVIAPIGLRKKFGLKDGNKVFVEAIK